MKLSAFKQHLSELDTVRFYQPNGIAIPKHFHITEVGKITKQFIDCGGTIREETAVNVQLWTAQDFDHVLHPEKILKIISMSENLFGNKDLEIEIEYQADTIGKYGLDYIEGNFILTQKHTDCLAKDNCGIPLENSRLELIETQSNNACCTLGKGCC